MTALTPARVALIPAAEFRRLALAHPAVHRRIMRQVRPVVARFTAIEQSRERLAALGTMAAGLAHELNNPASAARRSAADLAEALDVIGATIREFVEAGIEREDAGRIADLRDQALRQCADRSALSALDAADAEDEMRDRLEALGVPDAWRAGRTAGRRRRGRGVARADAGGGRDRPHRRRCGRSRHHSAPSDSSTTCASRPSG